MMNKILEYFSNSTGVEKQQSKQMAVELKLDKLLEKY